MVDMNHTGWMLWFGITILFLIYIAILFLLGVLHLV
jgi:hypothetical protein